LDSNRRQAASDPPLEGLELCVVGEIDLGVVRPARHDEQVSIGDGELVPEQLLADRDRTAAIMHNVQDYHISPEEAARIANEAGVRLLVFYHLLPAPDGFLMCRLFAQGVDAVRPDDWTIAEDGSLYTLPLGSDEVQIGSIDE